MSSTSSFAAPPRMGRPLGCKPQSDKPKSVAEFVQQALNEPLTPPTKAKRERQPGRKAGIWDTMSPAQRSEYARQLAAKRNPRNMARTCQRKGTPKVGGWTHETAAVAKTKARLEAEELVHSLQAEGKIDPSDKAGAEATIEALTIVKSPGGKLVRNQWAKRLLRHYYPDLGGML